MSLTTPPPSLARLVALAGAGTAAAATGLVGAPDLAAVAGAVAVGAMAVPVAGPWALTAVVPTLGLLPGGGALAVAACGVTALSLGWGAAMVVLAKTERRDALLREELRNAEQEGRILLATIRRYPVLLEACQELGTAREVDQFAQALCSHARRLLPRAQRIAVHLGSGGRLTCRASSGEGLSEPGEDERFVATEARTLVRREGTALRVLEPLRGDRRADGEDHHPLRGVLEAVITVTDIGERLALEQLEALARLGGLGLAAVDLVDQARALALHDDLTGLYGQHEFLRRLEEMASAARRHATPLGLVMCDMDHLKRFNDTYGHAVGDIALKGVAAAIRAAIADRTEAVACRYGGEEFAVALPGLEGYALEAWAEDLRAAIAAVAGPAPVTASLGIAVLRPDEPMRAGLGRADTACYRAKAAGRNRIVSADGLPSVDPDSRILPRITGVQR